MLELLTDSCLVKSRDGARRRVQQGAVTINGRRLGNEELTVARHEARHDEYLLVRRGGRDVALGMLPTQYVQPPLASSQLLISRR